MKHPARIVQLAVVASLVLAGCVMSPGPTADPDPPEPEPSFAVGDTVDGATDTTWPLKPATLAFAPDGGTIRATCAGHLCEWPRAGTDGRVVGTGGAAISTDARLALVTSGPVVLVVDVVSGEVTAVFDRHGSTRGTSAEFVGLDLSPDGSRAASIGADGSAFVWSTDDGMVVTEIDLASDELGIPVFSPDGSRLAIRGSVFDATEGAPVVDELAGVSYLAWSADGSRLVGLDRNGFLATWETERFTQVGGTVIAGTGTVAVSPAGTSVAFVDAADPVAVVTWPLDGSDEPVRTNTGHADPIVGIAWSPDGDRLATASSEVTGPGAVPAEPRDVIEVRRVDGGGTVSSSARRLILPRR